MSGYLIKITLENTPSPVWRKVIIPAGMNFYDLHTIIQICFGWEDMHMHDFTFPEDGFCVGKADASGWIEMLPEEKTIVDDFLKQFKWIRYTYDFGDNWTHKILLEKEMPEYQLKVATLMKYKGDNYQEDSGGVWGGETMGFSVQTAVDELADYTISIGKQSKAALHKLEEVKLKIERKALQKKLKKVVKNYLEDPVNNTTKRDSALEKQVRDWRDFLKGKEDYELFCQEMDSTSSIETESRKESEGVYEQMTLPFLEIKPEEPEHKSEELYLVQKVVSSDKMEDFLSGLNMQQAKDYCRYLQLPYEEKQTKKSYIHACVQELRNHPEYFLYLLEEDNIRELQQILDYEDGRIHHIFTTDSIAEAIVLGLVKAEVKGKGTELCAELKFAQDAEEMIKELLQMNRKEYYNQVKKVIEQTLYILKSYGVIDGDTLFDIYKENWRCKLEREDYFRIIYWCGRMKNYIKSAVSKADKKSYFSMCSINLEAAVLQMEKNAKGVAYKKFRKGHFQKWKNGFCGVYPCWEALEEHLIPRIGNDVELLGEIITDVFVQVANGASCTEILGMLMEYEPSYSIAANVDLWMCIMDVTQESLVAGLKGYTRRELMEITNSNPFQDKLIDPESTADIIDQKTSIFEMPAEVQFEVYHGIHQTSLEKSILCMETISARYPDNEELLYLLASLYDHDEQYKKGQSVVKRLKKLNPEDSSITCLEEDFKFLKKLDESEDDDYFNAMGWNGFGEFQEPFRRESPKIGRNDLCPCGSGKKYKRCCGK